MANTLLTKLKAIVANDNLPLFGKFRIYYDFDRFGNPPALTVEHNIQVISPEQLTLHLDGGLWVSNNSSDLVIPATPTPPSGYGTEYKFTRTTTRVTMTIESKSMYVLRTRLATNPYIIGIENNLLQYVTERISLTNVDNPNTDFDILDPTTFSSLIDVFVCANTPLYTTNAKGNINKLVKCIGLNNLRIGYSPLITGSIKELADGMVSNGRTSGTLGITCNGTITVEGTITPTNDTGRWVKFGSTLPGGAEYVGTGYAVYTSDPDA